MKHGLRVPQYVLDVFSLLTSAGFEAYIVGGSVRDALMERIPQDWDLTTNATPEQIQAVFGENCFYDNSFGTVGVVIKIHVDGDSEPSEENAHNEIVHVTTYRSEGEYTDFRRPDSVKWGASVREDLERRDFTFNAVALKIDTRLSTAGGDQLLFSNHVYSPNEQVVLSVGDYVLVDPYGGLVDLHKRVIRAVGTPTYRFREDALRMLRAVRFHSQLDFVIEDETRKAIILTAENLTKISGERIRDELLKILICDRYYEGVRMLHEVGILRYIFPELVAGEGLDQRGHHKYDVFDHSMEALKYCPSKDPIVRLAALLHDVGKPVTHEVRDGINTFYNHDIVGGKMVNQIAHRLHLSKKDRERLYTLVRYHMFSVDTIQTDSAIRRFIVKVGVDNISDMIDVRIGDRLGSGTKDAEGWRLKEFKKRIEHLLMPTFTVKDLAIDGRDVMRILDIKPGPKVGEILNQLFEEVLDEPEKNTKEYLEQRVREIYG